MPLFGRNGHDGKRRHSSPAKFPRNRALTASGMRIQKKDTEVVRRLIQPWQSQAFAFYDQVPEIKYSAQFYARMLSPLILYAAEYTDENMQDFQPTEDPEAIAALARIQDPGGGRQALMGDYGRLMFLTGECYLFVSRDEYDEEQWEFLSTDELRVQGGIYMRYKAPSLAAEEYYAPTAIETDEEGWEPVEDNQAVAYRIWQRHPRYSYLADSTMQGVLEVCEELVILTKAVRARARNRAVGPGLLFIDDRISPPPADAAPDEDPEEDVFLSEMSDYIMAPIADEGSAAAAAPYLIRVPVPEDMTLKDMVYHLQLQDPMQLYPETGLRRECIERLAIGLDMPPEELLGIADVNHWSAWMIDEKTWKAHGQPKAQQLCNDLTQSYFRPYLREAVGMGEEAKKYLIAFDASAIINHPDRAKDAKDLYNVGELSGDSLREASGFDDNDKPSEEERARYVGIKTHDSSLAWYGIPSVKSGGGLEPEAGVIDAETGEVGTPSASTGAEVEPGAPSSDTPPDESVIGSTNGHGAVLVARIVGASEMGMLRAREVAGARIRSSARKHPDMAALIDGVPNRNVASTLGREHVRALAIGGEREMISGSRDLILSVLKSFGVRDQEVLDTVIETVEQHAIRTLYDPQPRQIPEAFGAYLRTLV